MKDSLGKLSSICRDTLAQTTVEPVIFFNFLALPFFHVTQQAVLYKSICLQHYSNEKDPNVCYHLHTNPTFEDQVQKDASSWNMYLSLSYLLPAIASDIFLGAWSDRNGRKVSIMIGFAGLISTSVAFTTLAVFPYMPLYTLLLANIAAGATGYVAIVLISAMAYLSDIVQDKKTMTFRMTVTLIFRWVADVIGSFSTGIVLKLFNPSMATFLAQCFFAMGFFYTLFRLRQMPPEQLRKLAALEEETRNRKKSSLGGKFEKGGTIEKTANSNGLSELKNEKSSISTSTSQKENSNSVSCCEEFKHTCKFVLQLYKEVLQTLGRRRKCHKRLHIFICTLVFFCLVVAEVGLQSGPIMGLYVFHRPFYWTASDLGTYRGVQSVCSLIGSILGAFLTKYLQFRDTTMMLLAIASGFVHLTLVGLARWSWMLYVACAIGSFNSLLFPAVKAFLVSLVDTDEVGKTFAANGIAADLAFVFSTLVFTNIYSATVSTYAGTVFLVAAAILAFCFGATLWMRIDYNRKHAQTTADTISTDRPNITAANFSMTPMSSPKPSDVSEGHRV